MRPSNKLLIYQRPWDAYKKIDLFNSRDRLAPPELTKTTFYFLPHFIFAAELIRSRWAGPGPHPVVQITHGLMAFHFTEIRRQIDGVLKHNAREANCSAGLNSVPSMTPGDPGTAPVAHSRSAFHVPDVEALKDEHILGHLESAFHESAAKSTRGPVTPHRT